MNRETNIPARPPLVDDVLSDPHSLVALTRDRFDNASENPCGILVTKAKWVLQLRVSRPQLDRCLRLMDTLFKSWETEGLSIEIFNETDGKQHEIEGEKRRAAAEEARRQRELEWARRQAACKREEER